MRRTIQVAGPAAALMVGTMLGACAPVMSHGPRVEEGTFVGASVAVFETRGNEEFTAVIPYLTSGERHDDGTATQFTIQFVIPPAIVFAEGSPDGLLNGVQWDYYRELPSDDPARAHGRGIHVSLSQLMPYAQWGIYSDRLGFYTTQGIGTIGQWFGLPPEGLFWSPGGGVEYLADGFTVRAQVSTMALWMIRAGTFTPEMPITVGFTVELGGRDPTPAAPAVR